MRSIKSGAARETFNALAPSPNCLLRRLIRFEFKFNTGGCCLLQKTKNQYRLVLRLKTPAERAAHAAAEAAIPRCWYCTRKIFRGLPLDTPGSIEHFFGHPFCEYCRSMSFNNRLRQFPEDGECQKGRPIRLRTAREFMRDTQKTVVWLQIALDMLKREIRLAARDSRAVGVEVKS